MKGTKKLNLEYFKKMKNTIGCRDSIKKYDQTVFNQLCEVLKKNPSHSN